MYMQCGIIIVKPLRSKGTDYNGPFLYDGRFVSTAASLFTEESGGIPSIPEEDGAGGAMGVSYKF